MSKFIEITALIMMVWLLGSVAEYVAAEYTDYTPSPCNVFEIVDDYFA